MGVLAALVAVAFIVLWVRDKDRADEVSSDPERTHADDHLGSDAREGAAEVLPPDATHERRY
jgi:hypothetical protein